MSTHKSIELVRGGQGRHGNDVRDATMCVFWIFAGFLIGTTIVMVLKGVL